jgi:hypothetical protein
MSGYADLISVRAWVRFGQRPRRLQCHVDPRLVQLSACFTVVISAPSALVREFARSVGKDLGPGCAFLTAGGTITGTSSNPLVRGSDVGRKTMSAVNT